MGDHWGWIALCKVFLVTFPPTLSTKQAGTQKELGKEKFFILSTCLHEARASCPSYPVPLTDNIYTRLLITTSKPLLYVHFPTLLSIPSMRAVPLVIYTISAVPSMSSSNPPCRFK